MTPDRPGRMVDDVLGWPDALEALLDAYARPDGPLSALEGKVADRVLLTGLGSSRFAALTVVAHLRASGMVAWTEVASPDAPTPPSVGTLVLAISASGSTAEVVDAVRRHRSAGPVVAVTNRPGSAVTEAAAAVLPLLAGDETSGVSCRTYGATLAVLGLTAARLGAAGPSVDQLRVAVPALRSLHAARSAWLPAAAELLDGAPSIDVLADPARPGTAAQAALMLREGPRLPAWPQDLPDWSHVAVYTALPGHRAVLFGAGPSAAEVVRVVAARGGGSLAIGDPIDGASMVVRIPLAADAHTLTRAIVEISVADLLAAELWRRATATG